VLSLVPLALIHDHLEQLGCEKSAAGLGMRKQLTFRNWSDLIDPLAPLRTPSTAPKRLFKLTAKGACLSVADRGAVGSSIR
jgi:hypothetical protein